MFGHNHKSFLKAIVIRLVFWHGQIVILYILPDQVVSVDAEASSSSGFLKHMHGCPLYSRANLGWQRISQDHLFHEKALIDRVVLSRSARGPGDEWCSDFRFFN